LPAQLLLQDPAQEESEQYPNQAKTATVRRRPKSGPPAFLGGTQVFGVDPATLQLADVLHTLNIMEGNRERSWRDSFEDIEQEIRAQRAQGGVELGSDQADKAGPAAVQKFATDKLNKLIKLQEEEEGLQRPIKSSSGGEWGSRGERCDAPAPTNKMFQSCQTDLSHLRSSHAQRKTGEDQGGNDETDRTMVLDLDLDERVLFGEDEEDGLMGDDDVEEADKKIMQNEEDLADEVQGKSEYGRGRAMSIPRAMQSNAAPFGAGAGAAGSEHRRDGFLSPAGDKQGSEYERAETERQERLKQRNGARMRFDMIDPELSEATTTMLSGSPPKVGVGVPKLALEILRSPRTGSAGDGTPSPDHQTIGTLSPDPTKMMAHISSPRSAFSRHSSRSGISDMLRETSPISPSTPRSNFFGQ
jgi:hypothetical protein